MHRASVKIIINDSNQEKEKRVCKVLIAEAAINIDINSGEITMDRSGDDCKEKSGVDSTAAAFAPKQPPLNFPGRLMKVLQNEVSPESMYWLPDGDKFAMHTELVEDLLVSNFQGAKWMSFTRTLNKWGFRKVLRENLPKKVVAYYHPHFLRDSPDQVTQIVNLKKFAKRNASPALPQGEKNLKARAPPPAPSPVARASTSLRDASHLVAATVPYERSLESIFGGPSTENLMGASRAAIPTSHGSLASMPSSQRDRLLQVAELQLQRQLAPSRSMFDHLQQGSRAGMQAELLIQQQLAASSSSRISGMRGGSYLDLHERTNVERQILMVQQQQRISEHQHLLLQAEQRRNHVMTAGASFPGSSSLAMAMQRERELRYLEQIRAQQADSDSRRLGALMGGRRTSEDSTADKKNGGR